LAEAIISDVLVGPGPSGRSASSGATRSGVRAIAAGGQWPLIGPPHVSATARIRVSTGRMRPGLGATASAARLVRIRVRPRLGEPAVGRAIVIAGVRPRLRQLRFALNSLRPVAAAGRVARTAARSAPRASTCGQARRPGRDVI
jgi:hypothetical protein